MDKKKEYTDKLLLDFKGHDGNFIPVVTQNSNTKEVLILSSINEEAFQKTLSTGYACYYSRSRNVLWEKGATSGDRLKIDEIRVNCEQNSLLFLVTPVRKGACHAKKGNGETHTSCYYRKINDDGSLEFIEN